ncbi:MAG: YqiA/YcfP family alpha/beta fold hydrolase [Bacteroidota bacterium]
MTIIYLHGFNSDGHGNKYDILRKSFPQAEVLAPDLPANPDEVIGLVESIGVAYQQQIQLVGTSLGGFYAYYFSAKWKQSAFLYNPSMRPHATLHRGVGQFKTWVKGRDYHFKAEYLKALQQLKEEADALVQPSLLHFFLATDDDVLDLRPLPRLFPDAAYMEWYNGVGHSFSGFRQTMGVLRERLG